MSRYPCGICKIGVKYQAIQCTGPCKQWHHSKCLDWTDKYFKRLAKEKIQSWKCVNCVVTCSPQSPENPRTTPPSFDLPNHEKKILNSPIATLEKSLIDNNLLQNSASEEDKLTMAATIGSALLEENTLLKEQLSNLEIKVADLQCKLLSCEAKIEEMSEEEGKYLCKIETLSLELVDSQAQVEKERKNLAEINKIFEDHDKRQEQLITAHVKNINDLQKQILLPNQNLAGQTDIVQLGSPRKTNTETQTTGCEMSLQTLPHNVTTILLEIAQIKARQDNLETEIKNFSSQPGRHSTTTPHQSVLYEQSTKNDAIPIQETIPNRASGVMNTPKTLRNGPPTRRKSIAKFHETNKCREKKNNQFSVSLQVKKMKTNQEKIKTCSEEITIQNDILLTSKQHGIIKTSIRSPETAKRPQDSEASPKNVLKISKTPPMNSKLRPIDETYEEFFSKHIAFFKSHMVKHYGYLTDNNASQTSSPTAIPPHKDSDQQPLNTVQLPAPTMHSTTNDLLHQQKHFLDQNSINSKIK